MLKAQGVGRTDVGRVRGHNEDCFVVDEALGLYAVSDGMGGHAGGEVASRFAIDTVVEVVGRHREVLAKVADGSASEDALTKVVHDAVAEAARRVYALATSPEGQSGMGCTLTVLLHAGKFGAMAHVGDSRLYQLRGTRVSQLSQDHTMVAELIRNGMGDPEALKDSPFAHVLSRAVGPQPEVKVDSLSFAAISGDRYLLCSDGFSNHLAAQDDLTAILTEDLDATAMVAAADHMVKIANDGGGDDNITVVVVTVGGEAPQPGRSERVEARYDALTSMFMFADLDRPMTARVLEACAVELHEAGDVVIEIGDTCNELLVVVDGQYELSDETGTIGKLGTSDFAGATTLIKTRPSRACLKATEASRLLRLTGPEFSRLIRRRPRLGIFLLERLGNKISEDLDRSYQQREGSGETVSIRERF